MGRAYQRHADDSLFILIIVTRRVYVLVHVDYIIILGSDDGKVEDLIKVLYDEFALKDMGDLHYFLEIGVAKTEGGSLLLKQSKYIKSLLGKTSILEEKGVATQISSSTYLALYSGHDYVNATQYRSIARTLQYASLTRLHLSYAVNKVYQYMTNPKEGHWIVVKRILRYSVGTVDYGIEFK